MMPPKYAKLAIITGAASGLGRAFCRELLAAHGSWHIVLVDIDERGAAQTLAEVERQARIEGQCIRLDVASANGWLELRQRLQRDWPRLDLLVNNAGVCMSAEVGDGGLAAWQRVNEVNYLGVLYGCHTMVPWLKASAASESQPIVAGDRPAIINIASIMGLTPTPALGAYCASKAAVIAISESLYAELRPHGVNVTVAAPWFFSSALLNKGVFAARQHLDQADELVRKSTIDADAVAREALRASHRGQLYAVIGRRARWFWRLKRSAPTLLLNLLSRRYEQLMKREADDGPTAD
jgi:NAD(P)-dependent dehydrogenase (short-subunit alcohol dehydrogenase family)